MTRLLITQIKFMQVKNHNPFAMKCPETRALSGIENDMVKEMSKTFNFTYDYHISVDGEWGRAFENGSWTGMIGMVQRKVT